MTHTKKPQGAFDDAVKTRNVGKQLGSIDEGKLSELRFVQVRDPEVLSNEWFPLLVASFPDENDRGPESSFLTRLNDPVHNKFHLLRDREGNAVGIEMMNRDPDIHGPIYVPYAAVAPESRGLGIYPKMAQLSDQLMRQEGAQYILYDLEDPTKIHEAFGEEPGGEASKLAARRLNFWRRAPISTIIVNDPDLPYYRPAASDSHITQNYDLLAFRALGNDYSKMPGIFSEDGTKISKDVYRRFYLEMMRLQYGNKPEAELCSELPAIEKFLSNVDRSPKQWVDLHKGAVRPKATPNVRATVTVAPETP